MPMLTAQKKLTTLGALAMLGGLLGGCGSPLPAPPGDQDGPPDEHRDMSHVPDAVPKVEPRSRGGNPETYVVLGKRYYTLSASKGFSERGIASWYGRKFHGRLTSNGEVYDMYAMTAAHKRLPIPTYVEVVNLENGRRVVVRVNDRGPFHENRVIDLSYTAASRLGMLGKGTALVEVRAIDPTSPGGGTTRVAQEPAAPSPARAADGTLPKIYLQAGAFSSSDNAERLRQTLQQGLARQVSVIPAATGAGSVHRVRVGPLTSVEIADQVSAQMHQLGVSKPLVVID